LSIHLFGNSFALICLALRLPFGSPLYFGDAVFLNNCCTLGFKIMVMVMVY
jgi:hypothetical protein